MWKNRLSIADGNKYRKLLAVATDRETDMNAEIKTATQSNTNERAILLLENKKRENAAIAAHDAAMSEYENRINDNGGGLARLSVIAQFIFFCCLFYRSHYLIETAKQYSSPNDNNEPNGGKGKNTNDYRSHDFEEILNNRKESNNEYLNQAKMRVLPSGKSPQSHLTSQATHTRQTHKRNTQKFFVPTDLSIAHTDRQTGKVKRLNISQVRANISANKTRLRRAKETGTEKQIENIKLILEYWWGKENELVKAAANLEQEFATG